MTATTETAALATVRAYHDAWTSHDLDTAMTYVADDVVCVNPGGRIEGAEPYRAFLGGFMSRLTGVRNVAAFGDETSAALFYYPHTAATDQAATAEYFTVADGRITSSILLFDRPSFADPQG